MGVIGSAGSVRLKRLRALGAASATALLLACAAQEPNVAVSPQSNISESQRLLLLNAAAGTVPLVVDAPPPVLGGSGGLGRVADLAQEGVADYTRVTFAPEVGLTGPQSRPRLVLRFRELNSPDPAALCRGELGAGPTPSSPPRLQVTLCDGERPVGTAIGIARSDAEADVAHLVTRTVNALFPPSQAYGGASGYNIPGVSIFGGLGTGGSGVGVGLGF